MAASANVLELLARTRLFGTIPPTLCEAIAQEMRDARYRAGQSIFERGDPGSVIYLVLEGRVRLSVSTAEGRELSFTHAVAGDIFGEIAALDGSPRSATASALTDVRMKSLPAAALHRLIVAHPVLSKSVIEFLCSRLRDVSDHLEDVALFSVERRLARFLLHECSRRGRQSSGGVRITLGMSQGELALLVGASRPKVNTALTTLEELGAISRDGSEIVCNVDMLEDLSESG
jgi:CRP/FNR family transcriptional regulator, cyclic AMP receptor protein